jgi:type IV secretory pathway TrbL component
MTLSVFLSPLADGPQLVLFLLVVPPLCVYAVAAVASGYFGVRRDRAHTFAVKLAAQQRSEEAQWAAPSQPSAVTNVELAEMAGPQSAIALSSVAVLSPVASPSATLSAGAAAAAGSPWDSAAQCSIDEDYSVPTADSDGSSSSHAL